MTSTFRIKTLNYKVTVNSIYVENEISFTLNTDPCQCEHSSLIDICCKHIITDHLRIFGNSKFRKLLTKGLKYKEPRSTNFDKVFAEIITGLGNCIENLVSKNK